MKSLITSKFQTTIPKNIREGLKLSIHDTLEWKIDHGRIVVLPLQNNFLKHKNSIKIGQGNIENDLKLSREIRNKKYQ